jgi:maleate cis-trans isomerase
MYGKRGRIGLLVPSVNTVVEPDFVRMAPDGVNIYAARMRNTTSDAEDTCRMLGHVERAADELGSAHVDVIAFACTSGSFLRGAEGEAELRRRIEAASGAKAVVTTSGAVVEALRTLGVGCLSVATPYLDDVNESEKTFFEENGFQVLRIEGMEILDAFSIGTVDMERTLDLARSVLAPESDGLFISCTNLPAIDLIEPLEKELGIPVATSNQATFWGCLRALDYSGPVRGFGRLMRT